MKKALLIALGLLCLKVPLLASNIPITNGNGDHTVATTTDQGIEFQNVVVSTSYVYNASGVPKPLGYTATSSSMPVAPAPGATFPISGSISNTSFSISTGGVTAAQGPAGTADWHVTQSTNAVTGTVTISTGGVNATQGGTWTVNVATGGVTAAQGPPSTTDWRVTMSTNAVTGTVSLGAGTAAIGSFVSTSTVMQASASVAMNGNGTGQSPVMLTSTGTLRMDLSTFGNGTTLSAGQQTAANSIPVVVASNQGALGSVAVSTGGITVTQATAGNLNATVAGTVTISTGGVNVTGTVAVSTGGVTVTQATASNLNATVTGTVAISTGGVTVAQGPPATADWKVTQSTMVLSAGNNAIGSVVSTSIYVVNVTTVVGQLADNGIAAAATRVGTVPGIYQTSYLNGTAATQGRNGAMSVGTDGLTWTAALPAMRPPSFTASTGTITAAASATDIAALCGNASDTVLLYAMRASCTQTTAGNVTINIQKRSTAYTGVFGTMTVVAEDSTMDTGVRFSSATWFLANPTVGTLVGNLDSYKLGCMAAATATPNDIYISPADWRMKPIVLRGATQCVGLNLNGVTVTGGVFTVTFDWMETTTISP